MGTLCALVCVVFRPDAFGQLGNSGRKRPVSGSTVRYAGIIWCPVESPSNFEVRVHLPVLHSIPLLAFIPTQSSMCQVCVIGQPGMIELTLASAE